MFLHSLYKSCYLQNIVLVWVQYELEALVPLGVNVIIDVPCPLPALRSRRNEKLQVRVWRVHYTHKRGSAWCELDINI